MGVARRSGGLSTERPGRSLPNFTPNTGTPFPEELRGDGEQMDARSASGQSLRNTQAREIGKRSRLRSRLQTGVPFFARVQKPLWFFSELSTHTQLSGRE